MDRSGLILILISLITVGHTNSASINDHCDDPVICVNKPDNFESFEEHMDEFVKNNAELLATSPKQFDNLEETEPEYSGDEENCMSVTTVEKPFVIKTNVSSEYVVQLKHFEQKIRITRCHKPKSSCFKNVVVPGFGVETSCQEKYGSVSLYIYDPDNHQFQYKMFEVPVCCACMFWNTMKK